LRDSIFVDLSILHDDEEVYVRNYAFLRAQQSMQARLWERAFHLASEEQREKADALYRRRRIGRRIFWTIGRIPVRPFVDIVKAGQLARLKTITGEDMTQYLVAIHHPDDYDPSLEDEAMHRDIDVLNDEMKAAGVRIFVGGLHPASSAKSLRAQSDGKVFITDGPYLETKEHVGGFWVLEAADLARRWRGGARPSSPVGRRSRCARLDDGEPNESSEGSASSKPFQLDQPQRVAHLTPAAFSRRPLAIVRRAKLQYEVQELRER
jgi:hypothetical protein